MKKKIIIILLTAVVVILACFLAANNEVESKNTQLKLKNNTNDSVLVYLTLSGYSGNEKADYVQNVNGIFGIVDTGLVGAFYLGAGDSVYYTSVKYLSGNICVGSQPLNCKTPQWTMGINIFEFNLNCGQESIDISAVAGVNSMIKVSLIGGPSWVADTISDVRQFENNILYKNTNLVGVYPYGCTDCSDTTGKQFCQTPAETPSSAPICTPTRAAGKKGGEVVVEFKGFVEVL
jgi:hypothetical protein